MILGRTLCYLEMPTNQSPLEKVILHCPLGSCQLRSVARHRRLSFPCRRLGSPRFLHRAHQFLRNARRLGTSLPQFRAQRLDQLLGLAQPLGIRRRLHGPSRLHGMVVLFATALPSAPDGVSARLGRYP